MKRIFAVFIAFAVLNSLSYGVNSTSDKMVTAESAVETPDEQREDYILEFIFEIKNKRLISQTDENALVSFDIVNPTEDYYPELYYIPSICYLHNNGSYPVANQYITYDPVKFELNANETKTITYDFKLPNRLSDMEYAANFEFATKEHTLSLSKELIILKDINASYTGFLHSEDLEYLMIGEEKYHAEAGPNVYEGDTPVGVIKLKSTFETTKNITPEFKVFKRGRSSNSIPISTTYGSAILINKGEEKEIKLELPRMNLPESYLIEVSFLDENMTRVSKQYDFRYVVSGVSANIGIVKSKQVGNNIEVTATVLGPADTSVLKDATVVCEIYNDKQVIAKKEVKADLKAEFLDVDLILENVDVSQMATARLEIKILYQGKEVAEKSETLKLNATDPNYVFLGDVKGTKYEEAVTVLNGLGILNGYPDGTFKPGNTITRAEFSAIATKLGELKVLSNENSKFLDVSEEHWAKPYINSCSKNGVVSGYLDGTFKPENNVKYSEAITILLNILEYKAEVNSSLEGWPNNYLTKSAELGIHNPNDYLDISAPATRGDIAILTYNAYLRR